MDDTKQTGSTATLQEEGVEQIKFTWQELSDTLVKNGALEIGAGKTLVIRQIEPSDFLTVVEEQSAPERLKIFAEIMKRYSLEVSFEGSIALGPFNLTDQSWSLTAGKTGFLRILVKPLTMRKSVQEIVSFLTKLPLGQALALKPCQDLFLEELSADAMFHYYRRCQEDADPVSREKGQDEMLAASCPVLQEKSLVLKIYGLNAKQLDRAIDAGAGGILFKPVGTPELKEPRIVLGLIARS